MEGLERIYAGKKTVRLACIGSPSVTTGIPEVAYKSIAENRASSPAWMRLTGCPEPTTSVVNADSLGALHLFHGLSVTQGPNYALAKTLQLWRAMLSWEHVSFNNGPPAKTYSVTH